MFAPLHEATRNGFPGNGCPQAQPRRTKAYWKQYVEGLSGEHARRQALSQRRIEVPVAPLLQWANAAEAFMNNAG
jgi:hypothetical protein